LGDEFPTAAVLKIQQKLGTTKKYVKKMEEKKEKTTATVKCIIMASFSQKSRR